MLAWHKDVPLIVSEDDFIMQQVWNYWMLNNNGRVKKTNSEILTSETVRGVIPVLRSLLCALLFNWVIGRETKAGGNLRSRSLPHFPCLLRAWKQNHISDRNDILVKSCEVCFNCNSNYQTISHGTRTCIKRKKIHYGNFFYFCAEKCI